MSLQVIKGPIAVRCFRYWIGYASGNRVTSKRRRTAEAALKDAAKLEQSRAMLAASKEGTPKAEK